MKTLIRLLATCGLFAVTGLALTAQGQPPVVMGGPQGAADAPEFVPLHVQVTISRFAGNERTSTLPFSLWVNANERENTTLMLGQNVPVPGSGGGEAWTVRAIGTQITARATQISGNRYQLSLQVNDTSLIPGPTAGPLAGIPTTTSIQANNRVILAAGETVEFLSSTDRITGEVTRINVTVTVR